ncbi:uncharacterized protein PV09_07289 [Verruconis gallopava]|uniref:BZIP domain-containing protein n=1 Tax=Verruconis gallopava TaxID=253628 RepID=A0A0D1XGC0_9PEZI|nr:uncharacterized protein PV09_07289 [Verruconis gallopava]KIW01246.1 hypothetical protein PV09_07289 [Verruconis gallopava]
MPRKKSDIPSATRLRDNQRRSRARRKELILELQHRVHQYEQKELQATIFMQAAARKVARENDCLRKLLIQKGVSESEINAFLVEECSSSAATSPNDVPLPRSQESHVKPWSYAHNMPVRQHIISENDDMERCETDFHQKRPETGSRMAGLSHNSEQIDVAVPDSPLTSSVIDEQTVLKTPQEIAQTRDNVADGQSQPDFLTNFDSGRCRSSSMLSSYSYPAKSTKTQYNYQETRLEMSCETAAGIIAGMRGHGDMALARSELGCTTESHCNVKTVDVLQVMEAD